CTRSPAPAPSAAPFPALVLLLRLPAQRSTLPGSLPKPCARSSPPAQFADRPAAGRGTFASPPPSPAHLVVFLAVSGRRPATARSPGCPGKTGTTTGRYLPPSPLAGPLRDSALPSAGGLHAKAPPTTHRPSSIPPQPSGRSPIRATPARALRATRQIPAPALPLSLADSFLPDNQTRAVSP